MVTAEMMQNFRQVMEESGLNFDAKACLACIEYGKKQMQVGNCSVETYYKVKESLLLEVECANDLVH